MWTEDEIKFLYENRNMSLEDLAVILGRSKSAIKAKRSRLGIRAGSERGQKTWTDDEKRILRYSYEKLSYAELQDKLPGRSLDSIRSKVWSLKKCGRI